MRCGKGLIMTAKPTSAPTYAKLSDFPAGSVAEWLKAPVLKTGKGQPFVSSNLTASATSGAATRRQKSHFPPGEAAKMKTNTARNYWALCCKPGLLAYSCVTYDLLCGQPSTVKAAPFTYAARGEDKNTIKIGRESCRERLSNTDGEE